ncbi:SpoIIE family protein phosphatase [bacterium]|nr:SpoIIE family protein phosphatase [bacterium]
MNRQNNYTDTNMYPDEEHDAFLQRAVVEFPNNLFTAKVTGDEIHSLSIGSGVAEIIGYSNQELQSEPELWLEIVHPADEVHVRQMLARLSEGKPLAEVYRIYQKDGQLRWIRVSAVAAKRDGLYHVIGIASDASLEKSAPDRLVQYKQLLDQTPTPTSLRTISGQVIYCNQAYVTLTGYGSVEEAMLTLPSDIIPTQDIDWFENEILPKMISEPWQGEVRIIRKDGQIRNVDVATNPLFGENGEAIGFYSALTDVTQKKQAQEALLQSEERLRTLVENIDAIILQVDPNMRILTLGGQLNNWIGRPINELIGNSNIWQEFLSERDLDILHTAFDKAYTSKTSEFVEIKVKHKSGRERWVRGQITPRFDAEGDLIYYDGIGMDITKQMAAVEREARHSKLIAALVDMSQVFASTRDTSKIISTAVRSTGGLLNCICSVQEIEPDSGHLHIIETYSIDIESGRRVDEAFEQIGITIADIFGTTGIQAGISADLMLKSPRSVELAKKTGMKSSISVPLFVEGELFGVFSNARMENEKPFDDEDLWFMSEVASHASASLTNASLYRKQTKIAETLQRSLIPEKTAVQGLDTATLYLPAKGEVGIGGDFFDIIDFGDSRVGLVVADVSGKGLEAAIHTAEAKYMLKGFARQNPDPSFVMTNLNYALWTYMEEFAFVTMFYGLINMEKCLIEYVNAGHESPLILRHDTHQVRSLSPNGIVLGVESSRNYITEYVQFNKDDLLFCYTDGLTDVPCEDGTRFGCERLTSVIEHAPSLTSQELLEYVCGTVQECSKGIQPDDQVVVVVRAIK